jgi:iron complex transport system substrate-binding protein
MRNNVKLFGLLGALAILFALGYVLFFGSSNSLDKGKFHFSLSENGDSPPLSNDKMRIVSLAPSATEMLFLLGVGDRLIGATDYCDYPPEAKRIERVGGFGSPNIEKLLSLSPDLVVATEFERDEVARALRARGIGVLELRIRNIEELFSALRDLGEAVGRKEQAYEAIARMQADLEAVAAQNRHKPPEQRPRVFVEILDDPLMSVGGSSFLDDVVSRAGGMNLAHDFPEDYPRISAEKVIEWNPDVILLAHAVLDGNPATRLAGRIGWAELAAVRNGRIISDIPADLILRPGPRLVEGVKALAQQLQAIQK